MKFEHGVQALQLKILGYQFPAETKDVNDMNWLYIEGHISHPRGSWTFRDSCLMTSEVLRLARWLEAIAKGEAVDPNEEFLEPNLSFHLKDTSNRRWIRVCFELESRPPWLKDSPRENIWVEFPIIKPDLLAAAASLREQLLNFLQERIHRQPRFSFPLMLTFPRFLHQDQRS